MGTPSGTRDSAGGATGTGAGARAVAGAPRVTWIAPTEGADAGAGVGVGVALTCD